MILRTKKERSKASHPSSSSSLLTCPSSKIEKTVIARFGVAWDKLKWKKSDFKLILAAEYDVGQRNLQRWKKNLKSYGHAFSPSSEKVYPSSLSSHQKKVTVGYLCHLLKSHSPIRRETLLNFVNSQFDKSLKLTWASVFLKDHGFSLKVSRTQTSGFKDIFTDLAKVTRSYLENLRNNGLMELNRSLWCSIDFTYSGHRTQTERSYGLRGGYADSIFL